MFQRQGDGLEYPLGFFHLCDDFMKALCQLFTNYCVLSSDLSYQSMVWEVRFSYKFQSVSLKSKNRIVENVWAELWIKCVTAEIKDKMCDIKLM